MSLLFSKYIESHFHEINPFKIESKVIRNKHVMFVTYNATALCIMYIEPVVKLNIKKYVFKSQIFALQI